VHKVRLFKITGRTFTTENIGFWFEQCAVLDAETTGCGMYLDVQITSAVLANARNFDFLFPWELRK
jgi:hypothetical protein